MSAPKAAPQSSSKELLSCLGVLVIFFTIFYASCKALNPPPPPNPYMIEAKAILAEDNYPLEAQERICPILTGEIATACSVYRCAPKDITNAARKVCMSAREWDSSARIVDCVRLFSSPNNQSLDKAVISFSKALKKVHDAYRAPSPEEKEKRLSQQRRAEIQADLKKRREENAKAKARAEEERKAEELRNASVDSGDTENYPKARKY